MAGVLDVHPPLPQPRLHRHRHQELYYFKDLKTLGNVVSLRYAFLPYLYSEFVKAALANDMYMKPLSFVYEDDPMVKGIEDQLMVGESIMIAPVVTQNAPGRNVYLPEEMRMLRFRSADDYDSEVMEKGWHYIPCGAGRSAGLPPEGTSLPDRRAGADRFGAG